MYGPAERLTPISGVIEQATVEVCELTSDSPICSTTTLCGVTEEAIVNKEVKPSKLKLVPLGFFGLIIKSKESPR
jgi:hypothetical protein